MQTLTAPLAPSLPRTRTARWLLTGYLLLTLAYPGVKFVQEILMS